MENVVFADDGDGNQPSTSSTMLPAQPQNGTMRTYDNPSRTYSRPYSAKTVYFYKEGDHYFTGVRMAVSHHRYKTLHSLMDDLNRNMYLPFGVRTITTPMGRDTITSLNQLKHLGQYVASSSNPPKGVDLERIQQKYSASLRRNPQNISSGGAFFMTPTASPLRIAASRYHITRTLNRLIQSSKLVFFVLNGRGKFHRSLINPARMPTLDMILEECSTHLEVAIHRLYTPEGKLVTKVEDIMDYNGIRIIACPRNERPHFDNRNAESNLPNISDINPNRYAPRKPVTRAVNEIAVIAAASSASASSASNSIEKRERLPQVTTRYIPRRQRNKVLENGGNSSSYVPRTFAGQNQNSSQNENSKYSKLSTNNKTVNANANQTGSKTTTKRIGNKKAEESIEIEISSSAGSLKRDSGNGNSITSSRQSERAERMTDRKAQMIRDELRANLAQNNGHKSDSYSEEDRILEEDSDFDHVADPIDSGTEDEDSALGTTSKPSPMERLANTASASHRTPALRTPSTESEPEEVEKIKKRKSTSRLSTTSRQDTPYNPTPSRPSTSESDAPRSSYSTRPVTSSKPEQQSIDEEDLEEASRNLEFSETDDSDDEEEVEDDDERETPAIHTPDTRAHTANTNLSRISSEQSLDSERSAWSRISAYSDKEVILPSDEEDEEKKEYREAIVTIQAHIRGHLARKNRVQFEQRKVEWEIENEMKKVVYTIEIMVGDRFGIDFDTQLFVVINGENGQKSEKIWTEEIDWVFAGDEYYRNDSWIVTKFRCKNLGILESIDVGHEKEGYGAGTFIDRVVVSEELLEGRRFLFHVNKWFDSGQMDGLLERNIRISSYTHHIHEQADKQRRTSKGRWEFRLHTEESDLGGTTSNLIIVGYGERDFSANKIQNDSLMRDPTAVARVQLDFGTDIGELRKVRFEIEAAGDKPSYYLKCVEAQDLDTKDRCVMWVNNWLSFDPLPGSKRCQWWREVSLFIKGSFPPPVRTYEGNVTFADDSLLLNKDAPVFLQYFSYRISDNYEVVTDSSGLIKVIPIRTTKGNTVYSYKADFVTMYNPEIRVIPQMTELGKDIMQGIHAIGDIYQQIYIGHDGMPNNDWRSAVGEMEVGEKLFVKEIHQKPGDHMPFSKKYTISKFNMEFNNVKGPYFKHMKAVEAKPVETRRKYKKGDSVPRTEETTTWQLTMSLMYYINTEPIIPTVVLVSKDRRIFEMECQMELPERHETHLLLKYLCTSPNFGNPEKIRVSCEDFGPDNRTSIHKMKLVELNTGTEVFFRPRPLFEKEANELELDEFSTHEEVCFYPDDARDDYDEFEIHIRTLETGGGDFRPYINIIGELGDTGYRPFPGNPKAFMSKEVVDMTITSTALGELKTLEVWAKTGSPIDWKGTMKIIQNRSKRASEWEYKTRVLELNHNGQVIVCNLENLGKVDPVVEGESSI